MRALFIFHGMVNGCLMSNRKLAGVVKKKEEPRQRNETGKRKRDRGSSGFDVLPALRPISIQLTSFIQWPNLDRMLGVLDSLTPPKRRKMMEGYQKGLNKAKRLDRKKGEKKDSDEEGGRRRITQSLGSANECTAAGGGSSTGSYPHN